MGNGVEYWSGHLAAIEAEGITTKAYAEREGLVVGSLYAWRRRLQGAPRVPARGPRSEAFVPVQIRPSGEALRCTLTIGAGVTLELAQLPSPGWLAALSAAVVERRR